MKRPTRHSYSSISTYQECPLRYKYSYLDGLPSEPSAAMMRGTRLHSLAEDYMRDKDKALAVPFDLRKIGLKIHQFRALGALPEDVWLVDRNWEPVEDQSKAFVKAIIDVHYVDHEYTLHCYDYKSGRQYPSHYDQLDLYSVLGLLKYPTAKRVESGAVYIDSGITGATGGMLREMLPRSIQRWDRDIGRMENDTVFEPTPGGHCKWCDYAKWNGGPCPAGKKS